MSTINITKEKRTRVSVLVRYGVGVVAGMLLATPSAFSLSLKTVLDEKPVDLATYMINEPAAIALGKALFWDMQVGSDGVQACGTCHFHAGADSRTRNQINPGILSAGTETAFGNNNLGLPQLAPGSVMPDQELTKAYFPTHKVIDPHTQGDPATNPSNVVYDNNDVVSSQGVKLTTFVDITPGSPVDVGAPLADPIWNDGLGNNFRRVEPRNAPSVYNTAFNFFNFWDGRAHNVFNGANPFGPADPRPHLISNGTGNLATELLRLRQMSLASLSIGPPLSDFEMSFQGRTFPKLGKKMLSLTPLAQQKVSPTDSVLGGIADPVSGLTTTYASMIQAAFPAQYWNNTTEFVTFDGNGNPTFVGGVPSTTSQYTQMEANFSFFFGMAVALYQQTLRSDDTKFDQVAEGLAAFTLAEANGFAQFVASGCAGCHVDPIMNDTDILTLQGEAEPFPGFFIPTPLDQNPADANDFMALTTGIAMYDTGTHNTGVRPGGNHDSSAPDFLATSEDTGRGAFTGIGQGQLEVPLSTGDLTLWANNWPVPNSPALWEAGAIFDPVNPPLAAAALTPMPAYLAAFIADAPPGFDPVDTFPYAGRVNNGGGFKTANIRNASLTGPYMHNGGMSTLRQVVDFYIRGGDFSHTNSDNFDVALLPLGGIKGLEVQVDELVQFLMTLTDDRVANEAAPFDHPEIFVPVTGSADHQGGVGSAARDAFVLNTVDFQQVPAIGGAGRSAVFMPPLQPFLGLDPRDPALVPDADLDLIDDVIADNCTVVANPSQRDTDADGFGNSCDVDLNQDGLQNLDDFNLFKGVFLAAVVPGTLSDHADFNGDGLVNLDDFFILKGLFLQPPGPSALVP